MFVGTYKVGERVRGSTIDDATGEWVSIEGSYVATTDDPEEMIQDIIIRTDDGKIVYIDEQGARPVNL